jgi:hypothetical protein
MDHSIRYQLLDHATDESALWDARFGIEEVAADGRTVSRHRQRKPNELRPGLAELLRQGHVQLFELTDPESRVLSLDEALAAIADDKNWYSPDSRGDREARPTIYALLLTESGEAEFRQEYERANAH